MAGSAAAGAAADGVISYIEPYSDPDPNPSATLPYTQDPLMSPRYDKTPNPDPDPDPSPGPDPNPNCNLTLTLTVATDGDAASEISEVRAANTTVPRDACARALDRDE